eukprot:TRINITY_DN5148_c0_g1_i1.p1 TRINITY_DN5148_c0_g1~~TRINITY_DN5148_c0_g1_i1.p1  ORF type:complete len:790 (+),score=222.25 TRINITY_DN5148_c0_g1_i1:42-2411(+)
MNFLCKNIISSNSFSLFNHKKSVFSKKNLHQRKRLYFRRSILLEEDGKGDDDDAGREVKEQDFYPDTVGLSFGHAFSLVAVPSGEEILVIENVEGSRLTPSVVGSSLPVDSEFFKHRSFLRTKEWVDRLHKQDLLFRDMYLDKLKRQAEINTGGEDEDYVEAELIPQPEYDEELAPDSWLDIVPEEMNDPAILEELKDMDDEPEEDDDDDFDDEDDDDTPLMTVGAPPLRQIIQNSENVFYAINRIFYSSIIDPHFEKIRSQLRYGISYNRQPEDGNLGAYDSYGNLYSAKYLMGVLLAKMMSTVEESVGRKIKSVAIAVPDHYTSEQKEKLQTLCMGQDIVLLDEHIISEPVAAVIGYQLATDGPIVVYDMGGYTFNVSIVQKIDDKYKVIASRRDDWLGGEDFTEVVMNFLFSEFEKEHNMDLSNDTMARQRIRDLAEQVKRELSTKTTLDINLPFLAQTAEGPKHLLTKLSRAKYENLVGHLIDRTTVLCEECMEEAGITKKDITDLLVIGGMGRVPKIRSHAESIFGKASAQGINPDEAIVIGTCIQGNISEEGKNEKLQEFNILPISVGIKGKHGLFQPIAEVGSQFLPYEDHLTFTNEEDYQTKVEFSFAHGLRSVYAENVEFGNVVFDNLAPLPKGHHKFRVKIQIDVHANIIIEIQNLDEEEVHKFTAIHTNEPINDEYLEELGQIVQQTLESDEKFQNIVQKKIEFEKIISGFEDEFDRFGKSLSDNDKKEFMENKKDALKLIEKKKFEEIDPLLENMCEIIESKIPSSHFKKQQELEDQ